MPQAEQAPVDTTAVDQAYLAHRARRRAKAEQIRSQQLAARRFAMLLLLLIVCSLFLAVTIWSRLHQLFGF